VTPTVFGNTLLWGAATAASLGLLACGSRSIDRAPADLPYKISSITRDRLVGRMFRGGDSLSEAIFVNYVTRTVDLRELDTEAREVLDSVSHLALRAGDSLIVIQQSTPIGPEAIGAVRGSFVAYRLRPSGSWNQLRPR